MKHAFTGEIMCIVLVLNFNRPDFCVLVEPPLKVTSCSQPQHF